MSVPAAAATLAPAATRAALPDTFAATLAALPDTFAATLALAPAALALAAAPAPAPVPATLAPATLAAAEDKKQKRGRKPKGGKIIVNADQFNPIVPPEPNIILQLKCGTADLLSHRVVDVINRDPDTDNPALATFQFETTQLNYLVIANPTHGAGNYAGYEAGDSKDTRELENDENRLWSKIRELSLSLQTNSLPDKKSACFWCTCPFDNPPIVLPKYELENTYYCYGCFCSPECATAFLFKETLDLSTRFERYHLLNHMYGKIYNYSKNIKPAPNPFYTLNKYYGNLTIQEYRRLLTHERLLLVMDKPLSRILPELHEDNDDFHTGGKTITASTKYKLRKPLKQSKNVIISETFNYPAVKVG